MPIAFLPPPLTQFARLTHTSVGGGVEGVMHIVFRPPAGNVAPCPRLSLFLTSFHCFYSVCPLVTSTFILANATSVCQPLCLSHGLVLSFDQTFFSCLFLSRVYTGGISHVCMIYPPADVPSWS